MKRDGLRKLALAAVLVALGTAASQLLVIPMGATRLFPVQSMVNVVAGVFLGPWYAVAIAFVVGLLRNAMGTGSLFAFPGGMIGALCAGLAWRRGGRLAWAAAGEMVGTGILASVVSVPYAAWLLGKSMTVLFFVPGFLGSAVAGATAGAAVARGLWVAGFRPAPASGQANVEPAPAGGAGRAARKEEAR